MTELTRIAAADAPAAIGPYVQAVAHAGLLYCSGALPIDPSTGSIDVTDAADQARQCLTNLTAVCAEAGTALKRAVRTTIYTTDLSAFGAINTVYAEFFDGEVPARTTIEVAALPMGATVEIDAIVALR
ncbi:Rid family detoxifying hydrolase [Mycobacterium sp. ITM-2016-00317]|uniref:RidA family protein n=1 Tax=Mycobacterium sp. ITM-2016-00317 TaxID=2099694 RepID=UPI000D4D80E1|nr:Rid family detoxifying hydrolase [Mycobacterium sp. ITM-2016-00317]WNG88053.1 Rid family detoxifying hydrolase [Mycobacterium sp. ITM-2016-00317]